MNEDSSASDPPCSNDRIVLLEGAGKELEVEVTEEERGASPRDLVTSPVAAARWLPFIAALRTMLFLTPDLRFMAAGESIIIALIFSCSCSCALSLVEDDGPASVILS